MAIYQNCFLGVPLPSEYHAQLKELILRIRLIAPHFKPASVQNPHITCVFLGQHDEKDFPEIIKITKQSATIPHNLSVAVTTLGVFTEKRPRVVYLSIASDQHFLSFVHTLETQLEKYINKKNREEETYHLTLGRNTTRHTQKAFLDVIQEIEDLTQKIKWICPVTQINLYGIDMSHPSRIQRKIASIPIYVQTKST
jgi:2'-5' RNA ligase